MLAIISFLAVLLIIPTISVGAELNLGGGTPLWDTHTDDKGTGLDGGWLIFASIDKKTEAKPWLRYGLMYNYTRIKLKVYEETTKYQKWEREYDTSLDCLKCEPGLQFETTTTSTDHDWLQVHVLGPYAKPTWQMTKRLKSFVTVGAGLMYVDGPIYGDEFGGAGFASVGLGLDITKHLGLGAQVLYVKGYTSHVDDIDYLAPVATISFRW
jgi:hypothetical protein